MQYDFANLMDDLTLEPHRALAGHWIDLQAAAGGGNDVDPSHQTVDVDFQRQYRIPAANTASQAIAS